MRRRDKRAGCHRKVQGAGAGSRKREHKRGSRRAGLGALTGSRVQRVHAPEESVLRKDAKLKAAVVSPVVVAGATNREAESGRGRHGSADEEQGNTLPLHWPGIGLGLDSGGAPKGFRLHGNTRKSFGQEAQKIHWRGCHVADKQSSSTSARHLLSKRTVHSTIQCLRDLEDTVDGSPGCPRVEALELACRP